MEEIDTLDCDDRHYVHRKADLDERLYKMYDKIEDIESQLIVARGKRDRIRADKITADNIYKALIYFNNWNKIISEEERRQLFKALISEVHVYEERKPNGQWLKSIIFRLPVISQDMEISLEYDEHIETVVRLQKTDMPH